MLVCCVCWSRDLVPCAGATLTFGVEGGWVVVVVKDEGGDDWQGWWWMRG